jgi:hypothetical protein
LFKSFPATAPIGRIIGGMVRATPDFIRFIEQNTRPVLVANLPPNAPAGTRRFVTDANATTFASVVAGGGANAVPVYSDGTNWRIG